MNKKYYKRSRITEIKFRQLLRYFFNGFNRYRHGDITHHFFKPVK